jgi:hypothetical protein
VGTWTLPMTCERFLAIVTQDLQRVRAAIV